MRTDTATFRQNTFKSLRSQGVKSTAARDIVAKLVYQFRANGFPVLADSTEIKVSLDSVEAQSVAVVDKGLVTLCLDARFLRSLQPLLDCAPTARQTEIADALSGMMTDLYSAIGDACEAYDAQHGHPADDAGFEARHAWTRTFPAVAALNARYDALKAESLAINSNVSAHLVDPDKASHWYDWVKDARGYRPTGFMTLAMVEADMERLAREPMIDEAA